MLLNRLTVCKKLSGDCTCTHVLMEKAAQGRQTILYFPRVPCREGPGSSLLQALRMYSHYSINHGAIILLKCVIEQLVNSH